MPTVKLYLSSTSLSLILLNLSEAHQQPQLDSGIVKKQANKYKYLKCLVHAHAIHIRIDVNFMDLPLYFRDIG